MKILIFAGGAGTRLWPLSRTKSPKQFAQFFEGKSTLQLAVERVEEFGFENIYISTNKDYVEIIKEQIPQIPKENILEEPAKRDLAAAIGLSLLRLKQRGITGAIAMIWSDHLMQKPAEFTSALKKAEKLIKTKGDRFIFLGENPRYANNTIGWINTGEKTEEGTLEFKGWKYQPEIGEAKQMLESKNWQWNPGYFIYNIDFVIELYKEHMNEMLVSLKEMIEDNNKLEEEYRNLEAINFDKAIIEKIEKEKATVIKTDMGWSDPGTLYAMKEATTKNQDENYIKGKVVALNSEDCLLYNEESQKLLTTIGMKGCIVVNTKDAILVCKKEDTQTVKELINKIKNEGLEQYL